MTTITNSVMNENVDPLRRCLVELHHHPTDPKQSSNLFEERKVIADKLLLKMIELLKSLGASKEILQSLNNSKSSTHTFFHI